MSSYQSMLQSITCRFNDKVLRICKPLFNHLKLNEFWYYKVTNSGHLSCLCSHIGFEEYFAAEKLYLTHPYFRHPKFYREGISFASSVPDSSLTKLLEIEREKFNFHHALLLISKISDAVEFFGFSSSCHDEMQKTLLLNELPLLRLFTKKFREENRIIFSSLEDNKIDLIELLGPAFYKEKAPIMPQPVEKKVLLQQLGIENPLTSREMDVIKLLLQGFSARQIAKQLFLSKRTVEHHIERMKEKLSCNSKGDLIRKSRKIGYFIP